MVQRHLRRSPVVKVVEEKSRRARRIGRKRQSDLSEINAALIWHDASEVKPLALGGQDDTKLSLNHGSLL